VINSFVLSGIRTPKGSFNFGTRFSGINIASKGLFEA